VTETLQELDAALARNAVASSSLGDQIKKYFDERYGQYPPVLKAEADIIVTLTIASLQKEDR
jgi:hypothetical protein